MMKDGNVAMEFTSPRGAGIKICDDFCRDKTSEEVQRILDNIARIAYPVLRKANEDAHKDMAGISD